MVPGIGASRRKRATHLFHETSKENTDTIVRNDCRKSRALSNILKICPPVSPPARCIRSKVSASSNCCVSSVVSLSTILQLAQYDSFSRIESDRYLMMFSATNIPSRTTAKSTVESTTFGIKPVPTEFTICVVAKICRGDSRARTTVRMRRTMTDIGATATSSRNDFRNVVRDEMRERPFAEGLSSLVLSSIDMLLPFESVPSFSPASV